MRKTTSLNSPPKRHFWDINAVLRKKKATNPIKAHAPTLKIFGSNELPYNWLKIFQEALWRSTRALCRQHHNLFAASRVTGHYPFYRSNPYSQTSGSTARKSRFAVRQMPAAQYKGYDRILPDMLGIPA